MRSLRSLRSLHQPPPPPPSGAISHTHHPNTSTLGLTSSSTRTPTHRLTPSNPTILPPQRRSHSPATSHATTESRRSRSRRPEHSRLTRRIHHVQLRPLRQIIRHRRKPRRSQPLHALPQMRRSRLHKTQSEGVAAPGVASPRSSRFLRSVSGCCSSSASSASRISSSSSFPAAPEPPRVNIKRISFSLSSSLTPLGVGAPAFSLLITAW